MAESTPSLISFLVESVTKPGDGDQVGVVDVELLLYRLFEVDSDNFSAFVFAVKNLVSWAENVHNIATPKVAKIVRQEAMQIARNYIVSVSAQSGQKGRLIQHLLEDKTETHIELKDSVKKQGMLERIQEIQGKKENSSSRSSSRSEA